MIAISLQWMPEAPSNCPEAIDVPVGIELEWLSQGRKKGVIKHWLETTYKWKLDNFFVIDD